MPSTSGIRWTSVALSSVLAIVAASPIYAQEAPVMTVSEYAPAMQRQDVVSGAYEIVHSAELGQVFVASTPSFEKGTPGFIHVLDDKDLHQIRQIQLTRRAFGLALDHSSGRLYVGHTLDGVLGVMDARGGEVLGSVELGQKDAEGNAEHTRMIALDETRGLAFVTSPSEQGVVWIVDTKTDELLHRIENAGLWAAGAAYDAEAGRFYSGGGGIEEISVFDVQKGERVGAISTGDATEPGQDGSKHFFVNLDIDTKTRRLFAADANTGELYVFDIASGKVLAHTPVGKGTLDLAFNDVRQEIYVTYRGASREEPNESGGLVVIDAADFSVLQRLPLETHPNSLEVSADGNTLFATVKAPHEETHPNYVVGALDSVVRFNLPALLDK